MAASARGLSMTRREPNCRWRSSVTRKTPPSTPTSSPSTSTSGARSISCWRARLSAFTMLSLVIPAAMAWPRPSAPRNSLAAHGHGRLALAAGPGRRLTAQSLGHLVALGLEGGRGRGVGVGEHAQRVGRAHRLEARHRGGDLRVHVGLDARHGDFALLEIGLEARERILPLPRLHFLVGSVLGGIVGGRVHAEAIG